MEFLLASNNKHKLAEMQRILEPLGVTVVTARQKNISLDDVIENGSTFAENALIKAKAGFLRSGMPTIADDLGLVVDALNGRPGIYSARYCGEGATDEQKNTAILAEMQDVSDEKRTARFVCSICCVISENEVITADGECNGKIGYRMLGQNGFGYDPIFMVDGNISFAQLDDSEKDKISHRGRALANFCAKLQDFLSNKKI